LSGRPRLDYAAVARLAFPFMLNSAVQAVLNATDTWFIGRLSPAATAAIGAVYWPVLVFVLLFGGVGLSVQTVVAQAFGGRRYARASQATWTALWASLFTVPLFVGLAMAGPRYSLPSYFGQHTRTCRELLVSPYAGRAARHRPLGGSRLFQRRWQTDDHATRHRQRRARKRNSEPMVHIRLRDGVSDRVGRPMPRNSWVSRWRSWPSWASPSARCFVRI